MLLLEYSNTQNDDELKNVPMQWITDDMMVFWPNTQSGVYILHYISVFPLIVYLMWGQFKRNCDVLIKTSLWTNLIENTDVSNAFLPGCKPLNSVPKTPATCVPGWITVITQMDKILFYCTATVSVEQNSLFVGHHTLRRAEIILTQPTGWCPI